MSQNLPSDKLCCAMSHDTTSSTFDLVVLVIIDSMASCNSEKLCCLLYMATLIESMQKKFFPIILTNLL